ncbi:SRPBCC family protein [Saccharothrix sp. ST-888]|uniref:SRPBCC family protein n=1 Tax=Saccharothrix sp. ST-888 TaxID=1427391 RepID=UPI0018CE7D84|nr:SRPBCC family protein [Saccharothrix sp. ST-888]
MPVSHTVTVEIAASPARVRQVLAAVERWPSWTASVAEVRLLEEGRFGVGSTVRIRQPRLRPAVWRVTVYEPDRCLTWQSVAPGVLTVARHRIEPRPDGGADDTLTLGQSGPAAPVLGVVYGPLTRRYLAVEAAGLKRAAEQAPSGT